MIRKRRSILQALGAIALVSVALLPATPARAASVVEMEARALVGGRYQIGGWLAVAVTLVNDGTPTEGWLAADTDAGSVRRFVEMPAGSRKAVTLYVQPGGFQREIEVRYEEPNGTVSDVVAVSVFQQVGDQVAIVGDGAGALRPQISRGGVAESTEPIVIGAADIPDRPEPMSGLSFVVWAADSGTLSEAQRRALERWIADGGQLIVVGGADWQARTAAFTDLLPLDGLSSIDGVSQAVLASFAGVEAAPIEDATVSAGTLRADGRTLAAADDGTALITLRPFGAGRVVLIGSDLGTDAFRGWEGAPELWARLLPTNALLEAAFGGGMPDDQKASAMSQALNTLPALEVPAGELLLAVIVGYILLIGPVSYLVLGRLDRRELAWITAPLLVLVFTACSYGIGLSLKGSDLIVNQIAIVRSSAAGSTASVETYAGVFSPSRATLDALVEADALVGRMRSANFEVPVAEARAQVAAEQGDPARLRDIAIAAAGFEYLRADGVVEHESPLSVSWTYEEGNVVGTVTNVGEVALADVAYISGGGGEMIGDLEPGASSSFIAETTTINRASASDQVYGFGGFDLSDPERRRIVARRNVIDSLVGYGGWTPVGGEIGGAGRNGPFVIGWHAGEGPMPILVEDQDPQRYAEVAEVVSIQPGLGLGEVTIGPGQLGITITGDGDVTDLGSATVAIASGSATFGLSLPLATSDMAVEAVEIIVGPDPVTVFNDPGGFGGFWPPGYLVELWNAESGEWTLLGDLATQNRFQIPDPASAVSEAGRLRVRVTVDESEGQPGQNGIFVSAEVSGVLDE